MMHRVSNKRTSITNSRFTVCVALKHTLPENAFVYHIDGNLANDTLSNLKVIYNGTSCMVTELQLADTENVQQFRLELGLPLKPN